MKFFCAPWWQMWCPQITGHRQYLTKGRKNIWNPNDGNPPLLTPTLVAPQHREVITRESTASTFSFCCGLSHKSQLQTGWGKLLGRAKTSGEGAGSPSAGSLAHTLPLCRATSFRSSGESPPHSGQKCGRQRSPDLHRCFKAVSQPQLKPPHLCKKKLLLL